MRYLMLVAADPDHSAEDATRAPDIEAWFEQVTAQDARVMGGRLRPMATIDCGSCSPAAIRRCRWLAE